MRNPYIVGRWLRGDEHYGRHRLLDHLLTTRDQATWVVGTRRMGKTSLLRQLEWLLDNDPTSRHVPLFWDIQACETADDLAYELFVSIEDEAQRFMSLGIDIPSLQAMDVTRILRYVQRALDGQGKQLLLLIDEAEALINVARNDNRELARLRRSLQRGEHRTILTATKQLIHLNELMRDWLTSPFLFGFNLINLWSLDLDATKLLIGQGQNSQQVMVDARIMDELIAYTNCHPYLIQYLCYHLFEENEDGTGHLRPLRPDDLQADHLLSGFLQIDFDHLSPTERRILLAVARHGIIDEETLGEELDIPSPTSLARFIYGMNKLGYLRRIGSGWIVGNEFLRRWVLENQHYLGHKLISTISDANVELLLLEGQRLEMNYLRREMAQLQQQMESQLVQSRIYGAEVPSELSKAIQKTRQEIEATRKQLLDLDVVQDVYSL